MCRLKSNAFHLLCTTMPQSKHVWLAWHLSVTASLHCRLRGVQTAKALLMTLSRGSRVKYCTFQIQKSVVLDASLVNAAANLQALGWLAATPLHQHLLVVLLDILSSLLNADAAQQAQQQLSVHANVAQNMQPWTVLLRRTCDGVKESSGSDTQTISKVLHMSMPPN